MTTDPSAAVRMALTVPTIRSAHFNVQRSTGVTTGVAYCGETGIEYDVRELAEGEGWNVNDDAGRDYREATLPLALQSAISANRTTERG